jgi:multiple sugar transport system substrate-binding protein
MKIKQLLTCVLSAMIATSVLAGCGSKASNTSSSSSTNAVTPQEKITLTFWNAYSEPENKVMKEKVIPKFEADHPNITVKSVQMPNDGLKQQVIQAISGNSSPDLMRMDIIWTPEFAKMGALTDITNLDGFNALKDGFFQGPLQTNFLDGKYYGMPLDTNTKSGIYSKKVLAQVGLTEPPKTYDELLAASGKLNKDQYLIGCDGASPWSLNPYFLSFGGKITDDKSTVATGYLNSQVSIDALTKLVDLYDKKILGPCLLGGKPDKWGGVTTDKYLLIDDGPWFFTGEKPEQTAAVVSATLPTGVAGSISVVGGEDVVMFKNAKHPKETWEFAKFLVSDFSQTTMEVEAANIPTVQAVANSPAVLAVPNVKTYIDQLKTAAPRTVSANWEKINDKISIEWESAFRHKKTPTQALNDACKAVDPLLK